jgi:hypothetical protein
MRVGKIMHKLTAYVLQMKWGGKVRTKRSAFPHRGPWRRLVVKETTGKYHLLALCVYQMMEAGGGRGVLEWECFCAFVQFPLCTRERPL